MEVGYPTSSGCFGASERRRETSTTGGVEEKEEIWAADMEERINQKLDRILQMLMMNQNQGPQLIVRLAAAEARKSGECGRDDSHFYAVG